MAFSAAAAADDDDDDDEDANSCQTDCASFRLCRELHSQSSNPERSPFTEQTAEPVTAPLPTSEIQKYVTPEH